MAIFYLVRHGKTDYTERDTKIFKGYGVNLSPLAERGIEKLKESSKDDRLMGADLILCSPYTRAVHSAAILSKNLQVDIKIETDLHEWLPFKDYSKYPEEKTVLKYYKEFVKYEGKYPQKEELNWETSAEMRKRMLNVLEKYEHLDKVLVVCHGMVIQSLIGGKIIKTGEIVEFSI